MLPNTFIAGAQKSGTTTLCNALNAHPHAIVSSPKEPAFFSRAANLPQPEIYEACFKSKTVAPPSAIIDGSTAYMVNPRVPSRISALLGTDLRFVFCLRSPVERTVSGYWHQFKKGNDRRTQLAALAFESSCLDDAVEEEQERLSKAAARGLIDTSYYADRHDDAFWNFRYFRNSLYSADLKRFVEAFGADRIKVLLFDDLVADPLDVLSEVAKFLCLDPELFPSQIDLHRNVTRVPRAPAILDFVRRLPGREIVRRMPSCSVFSDVLLYRPPPATDQQLEQILRGLVAPEVRELERLLKRELGHLWTDYPFS